MHKLQCELCDSIDIIKITDDVFQCQHCGCKYTREQAKSLILSGAVQTKAADFEIVAGVLKAYHGESIDVVVPNNVIEIAKRAFCGMTTIQTISLPENITIIQDEAFKDCIGIKTIKLPQSTRQIGSEAFWCCKNIEEITIPHEVNNIEYSSFYGCESLKSLFIPNSVKSIQGRWHDSEYESSYYFRGAFEDCIGLESLFLSEGVEVIGTAAFKGCVRLESLLIPSSVEEIGCCAFKDCTGLKRLIISPGVKKISSGAFSGCTNLSEVRIPEEVDVADTAFAGCFNLNKSFLPSSRWKAKGRCAHCGGEFEGFFSKKCKRCHKPKNY